MATKQKTGPAKGTSKHSKKPSSTGSASKPRASGIKKKPHPAAGAKQHKPAPRSASQKQRPKKKTYTDKELGISNLNGIVPTGVQRLPNAKKGKQLVEDREQMGLIMMSVIADKEGNIESKMMRARQMEEIREAKRAEQERRAEGRKEGFEERKQEIKDSRRKSHRKEPRFSTDLPDFRPVKKTKKRVSFG